MPLLTVNIILIQVLPASALVLGDRLRDLRVVTRNPCSLVERARLEPDPQAARPIIFDQKGHPLSRSKPDISGIHQQTILEQIAGHSLRSFPFKYEASASCRVLKKHHPKLQQATR